MGNTMRLASRDNVAQPEMVRFVDFQSSTRTFSIRDYSNIISGVYYWSLPEQFVGNKVGHLCGCVMLFSF